MGRFLLIHIVSVIAVVLLLLLASCTPQQRANCGFCKATGLCKLLGDDPNVGTPGYVIPLAPIKETK